MAALLPTPRKQCVLASRWGSIHTLGRHPWAGRDALNLDGGPGAGRKIGSKIRLLVRKLVGIHTCIGCGHKLDVIVEISTQSEH